MKRVAIYGLTSTDKNQTVENQLRQLHEVGLRLGWTVVAVFTDEGRRPRQKPDRNEREQNRTERDNVVKIS